MTRTTHDDVAEYSAIVEKLIGVGFERSLAANSIKLRFRPDLDPRGLHHIWIDPPWELLGPNGEAITSSLEYSDAYFEEWSKLFEPLNHGVLKSWYSKPDWATMFLFENQYSILLRHTTNDGRDGWYCHWYAKTHDEEVLNRDAARNL
jgi:hypothetical protein